VSTLRQPPSGAAPDLETQGAQNAVPQQSNPSSRRVLTRWPFFPQTLLWRTFLLIAVLMLLSVLAWFYIFTTYEREPRAHQLSQMLVSVVNLTRTALLTARTDARVELLQDLKDREGIHVYPAEQNDKIDPLPEREFLHRVQELVREQLGAETRLTLKRENERALFVSFRLEDGDSSNEGDEYWLALPPERLERHFPLQWLGWGAAALALSLAGAWLVMFHVTRPLNALEQAAAEIGRGGHPAPVPEHGPAEIQTLARNFNQMNADLGRLDEDRALILAGISHDLRTPLTRLRMGIELSSADAAAQQDMISDVEEMDRTIGQFLDFARADQGSDSGEAARITDLSALLLDLVDQYRKHGVQIVEDIAGAPAIAIRPQAMRRAVGNLIDNAVRYAGNDQPLDLNLSLANDQAVIELRDRGPGIPPAEIERLKLPFTRLDAARSNALGAGLGLAIVDRIVRSHNGSFELLPRDGGGLIARISLPAGR
jgi:two-component system, OmpR family, osmolarity sensor histidine kinase EnvZ